MEAKITFKNGETIIADLSGNSFAIAEKPTFPSDLSLITIETADETFEYHNAKVLDAAPIDDRYWFGFVEKSNFDLLIEKLNSDNEVMGANLDYCLMLLGEE